MFLKSNNIIPIVAGLLLTCFMVVFSTIAYYKTKLYVQQTALEKQILMMKNLQIDINSWLSPKVDIITELADELEQALLVDLPYWQQSKSDIIDGLTKEIAQNPLSPKAKIEHLLKRAKDGISAVQVYLGLKNGMMVFDSSGKIQRKDYDPRVRQWFIDGMKADKTLISDPFIGKSSNQLSIGVMSPVIINGKREGVISAAFFVNHIYQKVKTMKINGGYAFVIGTNGNIIIHPDKELINKHIDNVLLNKNIYDYMKATKEGLYDYNYKGEDKIMTFIELNNGWFAVITIKKEVLFSFSNDLLNLFFIVGFLMILLTTTVLYKLSKKSPLPISLD